MTHPLHFTPCEIRRGQYTRTDGQVAITTYAKDGTPTVKWIPPLPEEDSNS